jgi:AraC family transcriptional regulator of adaptative response/methylated-DNA-[protein]-cysteine methyltransferase
LSGARRIGEFATNPLVRSPLLSDLGWMLIGATQRGIRWLTFGREPGALLDEMRAAFPKAQLRNDEDRLYAWFERVRDFVLLPRARPSEKTRSQPKAAQSRRTRSMINGDSL